jgi:antitoxin ParD1/3/4/toxin ParE1/3/4
MARYIMTDRAEEDVRRIYEHIRERNPIAAKRVRKELHSAMRKLAQFPGLGHRREDVEDQSLRFWLVYSYLIAYYPDRQPLEIMRVIHGARDVPRALYRP